MSYQEQKDIDALEQALQMMREEITRVREEAKQAEDFAPDATEAALDKLEDAQEKWEQAFEKFNEAKERLDDFLENARYAAETYDLAAETPTPETEREADRARRQADKTKIKLDNSINKTRTYLSRANASIEKATSRVKIALIKAKAKEEREENRKVRINFTLPEYMKEDWKDLADDLSTSVSQMIREAMTLYTGRIKEAEGGLEKGLTKFGAKMEQVGNKINQYVDENVQKRYDPETGKLVSLKVKGNEVFKDRNKKERMKKRIQGLMKLQHALPIDKLAQTLEIDPDRAENIIYELVADGIEGTMENGVFKYQNETDEVIALLNPIIDKL